MGNESASGAARLPRTSRTCPGCGAPDGLFPDPRFIDVVHTERNFTRSSAGLFLSSCLSLLTARAWCQVAQKFTGGIGNKLCGECLCPGEGGGQGQVPGGPRGKATFSAPHPQQRSRDKRDRGSPTARAVADRGPRSVSLPSSALRRRREARGERRERAPAGHVPEGRLCLQPEAVQLPQSRYQLCISTRNR